jgi:ribonuclease HI
MDISDSTLSEMDQQQQQPCTSSGVPQGEFNIDGEYTIVYVDGSCVDNGGTKARGGYGVFWGIEHPQNTFGQLSADEKHSNNRAELQAACTALEQAKSIGIKKVDIHSDSKYVVSGMNTWRQNWVKKDWKKSDGKIVANKDKWQKLIERTNNLDSVKFTHVPGHSGVMGNEQADKLAGMGNSCVTSTACIKDSMTQDDESHETSKSNVGTAGKAANKQCPICGETVSKELCLQCSDCFLQIHYQCTDLPPYQLTKLRKSQRKYTCENCVDIDGDIGELMTQRHAEDSLNGASLPVQDATPGVSPTGHTGHPQPDMAHVVRAINTLQEILITNNNSHMAGMQAMESLIQSKLDTQVTEHNKRLMGENDKLREECAKLHKQVQAHSKSETEIATLKLELDKKSGQIQHMNCDLKRAMDELETRAKLLDKLIAEKQQFDHQAKTWHERAQSQERIISDLNSQCTDLTKQLVQMRDELSTCNDFIKPKKINKQTSPINTTSGIPVANRYSQLVTETDDQTGDDTQRDTVDDHRLSQQGKQRARSNEIGKGNTKTHPVPQQAEKTLPTEQYSKKQNCDNVLMLGDTACVGIIPKFVSRSHYIDKVNVTDLEDVKSHLKELDDDHTYRHVVIHASTLSLQSAPVESCARLMQENVEIAKTKICGGHVFVSLPTCRGDSNKQNTKIKVFNAKLQELYVEDEAVKFIENDNFAIRGQLRSPLFESDRVNLTEAGTRVLASNIKIGLMNTANIKSRDTQENRTPHHRDRHEYDDRRYMRDNRRGDRPYGNGEHRGEHQRERSVDYWRDRYFNSRRQEEMRYGDPYD